jgi:hypothetical protein
MSFLCVNDPKALEMSCGRFCAKLKGEKEKDESGKVMRREIEGELCGVQDLHHLLQSPR